MNKPVIVVKNIHVKKVIIKASFGRIPKEYDNQIVGGILLLLQY